MKRLGIDLGPAIRGDYVTLTTAASRLGTTPAALTKMMEETGERTDQMIRNWEPCCRVSWLKDLTPEQIQTVHDYTKSEAREKLRKRVRRLIQGPVYEGQTELIAERDRLKQAALEAYRGVVWSDPDHKKSTTYKTWNKLDRQRAKAETAIRKSCHAIADVFVDSIPDGVVHRLRPAHRDQIVAGIRDHGMRKWDDLQQAKPG